MKKRFKNILVKARKGNGMFFFMCAITLTVGLGTLVACTGMPAQEEEIPTPTLIPTQTLTPTPTLVPTSTPVLTPTLAPTPTLALSGQTGGEEDIGNTADSKHPADAGALCLVKVDGMEYALNKKSSYPDGTILLRRTEGDTVWERVAIKVGEEPVNISSDSYMQLAFSSKEQGMLVYEGNYSFLTQILTTEDGGMTWERKESSPEPDGIWNGHQIVLCLGAAGQGRFVIGYRYWGDTQRGNVYLTKDFAQTWQKVEMPIPEPAGMTFGYIEPVAFRREGESLFLEILYQGDNEEGKRMQASYEAVSNDGGETWELAGQEEMNFVPFE